MKAVLLAGGLGTRMGELTRVLNKHLLPVGDKPMLFWPLEFLVDHDLKQILVVVGEKGCGEVMRQVGDGSRFGAKVYYAFQKGEGGIAAALSLAEDWVQGEPVVVVLGDGIFSPQPQLKHLVHSWKNFATQGAVVFLWPVDQHADQFGIAECLRDGFVNKIVEKPKGYKAGLVVTGLYLYDQTVFSRIRCIQPSKRGELEITDVNNDYAQQGKLYYEKVRGRWIDCGTPEFYEQANRWARERQMEEITV